MGWHVVAANDEGASGLPPAAVAERVAHANAPSAKLKLAVVDEEGTGNDDDDARAIDCCHECLKEEFFQPGAPGRRTLLRRAKALASFVISCFHFSSPPPALLMTKGLSSMLLASEMTVALSEQKSSATQSSERLREAAPRGAREVNRAALSICLADTSDLSTEKAPSDAAATFPAPAQQAGFGRSGRRWREGQGAASDAECEPFKAADGSLRHSDVAKRGGRESNAKLARKKRCPNFCNARMSDAERQPGAERGGIMGELDFAAASQAS